MSSNAGFPRTLYMRTEDGTQDFTNKYHQHVMYDSLLVNDQEELEVGEEMGYVDSFHDALFGIGFDETVPPRIAKPKPELEVKRRGLFGRKDEESNSDKESEPETDEEF